VVENLTNHIGWNKPPGPNDTPVFVAMRVILSLPPGIEPPIGLNIKKDGQKNQQQRRLDATHPYSIRDVASCRRQS
jgi:hypothetical protein